MEPSKSVNNIEYKYTIKEIFDIKHNPIFGIKGYKPLNKY